MRVKPVNAGRGPATAAAGRPGLRQSRRVWITLLGAVFAFTACGTQSPLAGDDLSEAEKSRIAEAWRDCLAAEGIRGEIDYSNGIDIGVEIPPGISEEQVQAVEAKCEPILNDIDAVPELSPEQEAELADVMLDVQKCLAAEGYVVTIDGNGINTDSADQPADFDEAAYAEAEDRCFRTAAPELYEEFGGGQDG